MLTAKQARDLSNNQFILQMVLDKIQAAASNGESYIEVNNGYGMYSKDLEKLGYKIDRGSSNGGGCSPNFTISW